MTTLNQTGAATVIAANTTVATSTNNATFVKPTLEEMQMFNNALHQRIFKDTTSSAVAPQLTEEEYQAEVLRLVENPLDKPEDYNAGRVPQLIKIMRGMGKGHEFLGLIRHAVESRMNKAYVAGNEVHYAQRGAYSYTLEEANDVNGNMLLSVSRGGKVLIDSKPVVLTFFTNFGLRLTSADGSEFISHPRDQFQHLLDNAWDVVASYIAGEEAPEVDAVSLALSQAYLGHYKLTLEDNGQPEVEGGSGAFYVSEYVPSKTPNASGNLFLEFSPYAIEKNGVYFMMRIMDAEGEVLYLTDMYRDCMLKSEVMDSNIPELAKIKDLADLILPEAGMVDAIGVPHTTFVEFSRHVKWIWANSQA